jgi:cytochrome P450
LVKPYNRIPSFTRSVNYERMIGQVLSAAYQELGPIFRTKTMDGSAELVFLVGPEANRFVLASHRQKFSHHIGWGQMLGVISMLGNGLLTMDGVEHDQHRRMMNPAFTMGYMDRYLPMMQNVIRERTANWAAREWVDVYDEARKITFDVAALTLTGLKIGDEIDAFREIYYTMLMLGFMVQTMEEWNQQLGVLNKRLYDLLLPKIRERRANPTDDVLGMLVKARDDNGSALSDEQLIAHINILLVAGHETSTSLVAWLFYLLSQHPDYLARIRAEQDALFTGNRYDDPTLDTIKQMKVLDNALSEAERLYPPVANGPRGLLEDIEFMDYHVPAGTYVFYSIAGGHRLASVFAEPEKFDPDRFAPPREEHKKTPYALVGFGGGPRICIGINFAQVEIKALVSHVVRQMDFALVPGQEIAQIYRPTGQPVEGIKMKFTAP